MSMGKAARAVIFALVPSLALLLALELGARALYFHRKEHKPSALAHYTKLLWDERGRAEARRIVETELGGRTSPNSPPLAGLSHEEVVAKSGRTFPKMSEQEVRGLYEKIFAEFMDVCRKQEIEILVLHAPDPWTPPEIRQFFADLCTRHKVPLVDVSDAFAEHKAELTHLMPVDPHLSVFGNKLVAEALAGAIRPMLGHKAKPWTGQPPSRYGDLSPQGRAPQPEKIPFWLTVNNQGLRGSADVEAMPAPDKTRVLCVGDSFTYGAFMNDDMTFPAQLAPLLAQAEVINGGHPGYTICDEFAYLLERGRCLSPDVIVLQVLINDIYGLQEEWRFHMCRHLQEPGTARGPFCHSD